MSEYTNGGWLLIAAAFATPNAAIFLYFARNGPWGWAVFNALAVAALLAVGAMI